MKYVLSLFIENLVFSIAFLLHDSRFVVGTVLAALLFLPPCTVFSQAAHRDLEASLAQLPGLADTPDKGAFVDIVKAMDEIYPGKINIKLYPFARSVNNVLSGKADFHIPSLRNPLIPADKLPYKYVTERIGLMTMVIYSHVDKVITKQDILKAMEAMKKGEQFPYIIECAGGLSSPFPALSSNDWEQSIKKLAARRIDGIWNAQEETDRAVISLKEKTVHRENWGTFDDMILIQKSAAGDEVDKILSELLRNLRASGKLERLYRKVHSPYNNWQPSKMGW